MHSVTNTSKVLRAACRLIISITSGEAFREVCGANVRKIISLTGSGTTSSTMFLYGRASTQEKREAWRMRDLMPRS